MNKSRLLGAEYGAEYGDDRDWVWLDGSGFLHMWSSSDSKWMFICHNGLHEYGTFGTSDVHNGGLTMQKYMLIADFFSVTKGAAEEFLNGQTD